MSYKVPRGLSQLLVVCVTSATAFSQTNSLLPVAANGLWGYADHSGKVVIPPQFEQAFDFHEGLANVRISGKYGYADEHGRLVISPQFDMPSDFSEGLAGVGEHQTRGSIDSTWYGYIDHSGKMVIPSEYSFASEFHQGLAAVEITEENKERGYGFISHWGFIDKSGKTVIPSTFYEADHFSQGRAAVSMKGGRAYIDTKGQPIFGPEDTGAIVLNCREFSDGLAPIYRNGKVGFIDLQGKVVISPQFDAADCFSEGLAWVKTGEKYGFVDQTGRLVIPATFSYAQRFSEGLASVASKEGGIFYINKLGDTVVRGPFRKAEPFGGGIAFVEDSVYGMGGYIDTTGRIFTRFRIPEHDCPICASYFRPLLDMEIDSNPQGAAVYLVPVYTFEHQPGIEADDSALANFLVPYGTTNVSCKGCVYEQKYWAVFVSSGKRCRMLVDVLHGNPNRFSAELINPAAGVCR
jgi:hypothetical protein